MMLIQPQTLFPSCSPMTSKIAQASLKLSQILTVTCNVYFLTSLGMYHFMHILDMYTINTYLYVSQYI